jgi:hypothetical protein
MVFSGVVTLIARKYFGAATESEPAVTFSIVLATSPTGKFLAGHDTQNLLWLRRY